MHAVCQLQIEVQERHTWEKVSRDVKSVHGAGICPPPPGQLLCCLQVCYVLLQIENMPDMMTLTSGLTTNSYRRVSSGQASSCHSEPKGWGPLRLYLVTLCIALCTTAHSDSYCSSCRSVIRTRLEARLPHCQTLATDAAVARHLHISVSQRVRGP
jgi:hypothetical protein